LKKVRVHELAKKLGIGNIEMLQKLNDLGVDVKSHLNSIDQQIVNIVYDRIRAELAKTKKSTIISESPASKRSIRRKTKMTTKDLNIEDNIEPDTIKISEATTVRRISELTDESPQQVMKRLMQMGKMISINSLVEPELVVKLIETAGKKAKIIPFEKPTDIIEEQNDTREMVPKAPVITIMGHVDHGKTSLLDAIRDSNIIATEKGGITQHIGAYKVRHGENSIVFLDTPGHEAFTTMRARGAHVTDIVVLVVAADDGVMPQTIEAINHAKAAHVPIIVAINKIDKPNSNPKKIMEDLSKLGLIPEAWGGETIYVEISAKKRLGIEDLLEMIILQAEILELKASKTCDLKGTILEAKLDTGRGPVATILVQEGTLKIGDSFIAGVYHGKVRAMFNEQRKLIKKAGPSTPVEVLGFAGVPNAGDMFRVIQKAKIAKQIGSSRHFRQWEEDLVKSSRQTIDQIIQKQGDEAKYLNLILKADVQGSIEAISESVIKKSKDEKIEVSFIHKGVGGITETDILLASTSGAVIIGFNVRPGSKASKLAQKESVRIELFTIIYELTDKLGEILKGLHEPEYEEVEIGTVNVREIFHVPKFGTIAGSFVTSGKVVRNYPARLMRDNIVIYEGKISSLKRFKDDVKEVLSGYECGVALENYNDIKKEDIIEVFITRKVEK
jgi:translation initiation factor IF-2